MKAFSVVFLLLPLLSGCRQNEPQTQVDVMRDGSIVDVQTRRSDVHVGEEGIQVSTPDSRIDISRKGIRITD